jgi:uncharacterized protein (UPF0335 family)
VPAQVLQGMSRQLDSYLLARRNGHGMSTACQLSGLSLEEARLTDAALDRGEIPSLAAGQAAEPKGEPEMAKKTKPGDSDRGTNLTETKEVIRDVVPRIIKLKEERKAINADIQELRERVNAAGVSKSALDHAIRVREMDPTDREKFDEGYAIARDAMNVPISRSLFDMIETPAGAGTGAEDSTGGAAEAVAAARAHLGGNRAAAPDAVAG